MKFMWRATFRYDLFKPSCGRGDDIVIVCNANATFV